MSRVKNPLARYLRMTGSPERLAGALTAALMVGFATMAVLGLVELLVTRRPGALLQPVAAVVLLAWASRMRRKAEPRPELLLGVTITVAFVYLALAAVDPGSMDITDTSPISIIVGGGVIALAVGGRASAAVGAYAVVLVAIATVVVQTNLGSPAIEIFVDVGNSLIVMGVAFAMVGAIRQAMDSGFDRYRGLVESTPVAVVEADLAAYVDGAETIDLGPMNTTASAVLGYLDRRTSAIVRRSSIPTAFSEVLDLAVRQPTGTDVRTMPDGRTFKVGWRVDALSGRITISATDITAQRKAEEELSFQLSGRDRFIATVSHELRTPLTGAMGMLEMVIAGDVTDDERDEMVQLALLQVNDMADIVEDLLVAARAANGMLTVNSSSTDVSAAVRSVLSVAADSFDQSIEPRVMTWADPVRVRQIVKNLVTNAVRYGGPNRGVVVRTEGRLAVVEVTDDGPSLAPDFVTRMFEPYERIDGPTTESVGLGLTVARTLAHLMGGDVTYHHDVVATFRLTLPALAETQSLS
ncbi:MAG TPA: HAMP domain-containing sensor histidine kinase [Acidimicrobiia bacterium]|nr:HAMP domain-containing sensor histidine kinase [Acidimicrobiia bacterium]